MKDIHLVGFLLVESDGRGRVVPTAEKDLNDGLRVMRRTCQRNVCIVVGAYVDVQRVPRHRSVQVLQVLVCVKRLTCSGFSIIADTISSL